jgi:hypothetical protein
VRYDVALIGQDLRTLVTLRHLRAASPDGPQASITITPMHDGWLRFDLNSD